MKMDFNMEKYVCTHVDYGNKNVNCYLGKTQLKSVESEQI